MDGFSDERVVEKEVSPEELTKEALESFGFSVTENDSKAKSYSKQMSDARRGKGNEFRLPEEVPSFEPAAYSTEGKSLATKEENGHTITVAYTVSVGSGKPEYDAGVFVDDKWVGANHDFNIGELLGVIGNAIAMAKFERKITMLPAGDLEYEKFKDEFEERKREILIKFGY